MSKIIKQLGLTLLISLSLLAQTSLAAGTESDLTIGSRQYLKYVPEQCNSQPCSLVLSFHGHYGTRRSAMDFTGLKAAADQNNAIIVAPESLTPPAKNITYNGTVLFPSYDLTGKRWDIAHTQGTNRCSSSDLDFVSGIIQQVKTDHQIIENHIFSTGVSYGAIMSYYTAACLPEIQAFSETAGGLEIFPTDTVLVTALINSITDPFLKFGTQLVMGAWQNQINSLGNNQLPGSDIAWSYFPIPVPQATTTKSLKGLLIHDTTDTVVRSLWTDNLDRELTRMNQVSKKIYTNVGHAWDQNLVQAQFNWFKKHSPVLVSSQLSSSTCQEGETIELSLTLNRQPESDLQVEIGLDDPNGDFSLSQNQFTISGAAITDSQVITTTALPSVSQTVTINCLDDTRLENDTSFPLNIAINGANFQSLAPTNYQIFVPANDQLQAPSLQSATFTPENILAGGLEPQNLTVDVNTQDPLWTTKLELFFNRTNKVGKGTFYIQFNSRGDISKCLINQGITIKNLTCSKSYNADTDELTINFNFQTDILFGASANNLFSYRLTYKDPLDALRSKNTGIIDLRNNLLSTLASEIVKPAIASINVDSGEQITTTFNINTEKPNLISYIDLIFNYKNGASSGRIRADINPQTGQLSNCRIVTGSGSTALDAVSCSINFNAETKSAALTLVASQNSTFPLKETNTVSYKFGYFDPTDSNKLIQMSSYQQAPLTFSTN